MGFCGGGKLRFPSVTKNANILKRYWNSKGKLMWKTVWIMWITRRTQSLFRKLCERNQTNFYRKISKKMWGKWEDSREKEDKIKNWRILSQKGLRTKKAFWSRKRAIRLRSVYLFGKGKNLLTGPENCAIIIHGFAAGAFHRTMRLRAEENHMLLWLSW